MSLPWFRLYRELKDDPKIGCLTDSEFRAFIEAMCWACEQGREGGTGQTMETANWAFRRNVTDALQSLLDKKLLVEKKKELFVTNWNIRQKEYDSSADRVKNHRAKKKQLQEQVKKLHVTDCNVTQLETVTVGNGLDESRREETREEQKKREGDAPAHFSEIPTKEQAVAQTMNAGILPDFSAYVFDDWSLRGGKDASQNIVPWLPYVTKRWGRESGEWRNGTHKGNKTSKKHVPETAASGNGTLFQPGHGNKKNPA